MQYGVISDSHDNFYNLEEAIRGMREKGITTCFHLGDFCAGGIVEAMIKHKDINWICVWGNVDGMQAGMLLRFGSAKNFSIVADQFRELETPDGLIFLTHFPLLARNAAASGKYRASFYGHDHAKHTETLENGTLLANPGEIAGTGSGQPSFGIWDSKENQFEIIDLEDFRVPK
ncbi:MAG TPA: metallophosphoesterase family protein [Patescibacteria group bacterium]|jgi:putative phosphoesterase